jgi:hypothetical protein
MYKTTGLFSIWSLILSITFIVAVLTRQIKLTDFINNYGVKKANLASLRLPESCLKTIIEHFSSGRPTFHYFCL